MKRPMKSYLTSLLVAAGVAVSGLATAEPSTRLPVLAPVFEDSITVTFSGLEEALQKATLTMFDSQDIFSNDGKILAPPVTQAVNADTSIEMVSR